MSIYGNEVKELCNEQALDEGLIRNMSDKFKKMMAQKKHDAKVRAREFDEEDKKEIKRLKEVIKQQAPKVIDDNNKDKAQVKALQDVIDELLLKGPYAGKKIKAKFKYDYYNELEDCIRISIFDQSIIDAAVKVYEQEDDLTEFANATMDITNKVSKEILDLLNSPLIDTDVENLGHYILACSVLDFEFYPR